MKNVQRLVSLLALGTTHHDQIRDRILTDMPEDLSIGTVINGRIEDNLMPFDWWLLSYPEFNVIDDSTRLVLKIPTPAIGNTDVDTLYAKHLAEDVIVSLSFELYDRDPAVVRLEMVVAHYDGYFHDDGLPEELIKELLEGTDAMSHVFVVASVTDTLS